MSILMELFISSKLHLPEWENVGGETSFIRGAWQAVVHGAI